MPCKNAISFCGLFLISGGYSFAQSATTAEDAAQSSDTMVVSTSRSEKSVWESPASVQVIGADELGRSTRESLADVLRDIPGVEVSDNSLAGRKQIRIRGEDPSRVLVLIDGQEVTYQRSGMGSGPGLLIDESAIERIEVVKGPNSVLYGSQAIGGIINFITRKGGDKPFGGSIKTVYGSASNGWNSSGSVYGTVENFSYRLSGSYADHGDRKTPDGRLPNTNYGNQSQSAWLGYTLGRHQFGLSVDRYRLDTQTYFNDPGYQSFSVKLPKLEREKIGLFYDYDAGGDFLKKLHLNAYHQVLERRFENELAVSTPSNSPMIGTVKIANQTQIHDTQNTQGLTLQSDWALFERDALILGAQYQQDRVKQNAWGNVATSTTTGFPSAANKTTETHANNRWQQTNWALFGQNEWAFADNWSWIVGARQHWVESKSIGGDKLITDSNGGASYTAFSDNSVRDNAFVTATSLRYSGFDNLQLRMSFAQGYVFPTLSDLYIETSAGGGTTYGNPNLKAEHSNNYEIGARYKGHSWLIDSAVYYAEAKDYIASLACTGQAICNGNNSTRNTVYQYYANVNKAKTYGMEVTAEYNGWSFVPYVSGNLMRRQYETPTMKTYDSGEPMLTGRAGVKHMLAMNAFDVESNLFIRAASQAKDSTGSATVRYPGWATLNFAVSTQFGDDNQYQTTLALNNLTDKRYQTAHESIPAAGFNAALGIGMKF